MLLDTATTPELEAEGLARDVIRAVQDTRKAAGFDVSDRIRLTLALDPASVSAATTHRDLIAGETLATSLDLGELDESAAAALQPLAGGTKLHIGLEKA